jgi:hypothetical protein
MNHNLSAVVGLNPFRRNDCIYEKTIQLNDWYLTGGPGGEPLGNIQMLGRITGRSLPAKAACRSGWRAMDRRSFGSS